MVALAATLFAQAPTGTIAGTVVDESGAVIPNAIVRLTNKATGAVRNGVADARGEYSFPALQAGEYELRAEAKGFRTLVRTAEVTTGATTTAELKLAVRLTPAAEIERMPDLEKSTMEILGVSIPLILIDPEKASAPARLRAALDHLAHV